MAAHYDGSRKWEMIERGLERDGYVLEFGTSYDMGIPAALVIGKDDNGWAIRRKIKRWCAENGVQEFTILRNSSFHQDLHRIVYQLWVKRSPP